MSKNKKQNPIPFPQQINMDDLAVVDDDSLSNMNRSLTDSVGRAASAGLNPGPWEVELCYVQRELQIRASRKEAHVKYLAGVPAEVE